MHASAREPATPAQEWSIQRLWVPLALLSLYLIWGSTYFAIRIALTSYPPFLLAAIRFLVAGGVLYALLRWRGNAAPTGPQWRNAAVTGTLLLTLGNGLVCVAEQHVASGLAAVTLASMPLFAAIFAAMYGEWPTRRELAGLALGFAGVVLLGTAGGLGGEPIAALALLISAAAWAFGSIWSRPRDMPPAAMNTAAQMLAGGAVLLALALLTGESLPQAPAFSASLAIAYLALFGSLAGFTAYLFLLAAVRPALATSYAYVNPPVAVLIGALLGAEVVRWLDLAAMAVILAGVALIAASRNRRTQISTTAPTTGIGAGYND